MKPLRAKSDFMKVMKFNSPKSVIFLAVLAVAFTGSTQPFFGWTFALFLTVLTKPIELSEFELYMEGKDPNLWKDNLRDDVVRYTIYILIIGVITFIGYLGKIYLFSFLGEKVTIKVRRLLYFSILQKNIGFFDFQDN